MNNEKDDDNASIITIINCQLQNNNSDNSKSKQINSSLATINNNTLTPFKNDNEIIYSEINTPLVTNLFDQSKELKCPPIPPKKKQYSLQRINSQPNAIIENQQTNNKERIAPPRPTSKKPFWLKNLRLNQTQYDKQLLLNSNQKNFNNNYQQHGQQDCLKLFKNQSLPSNESFKLYQTRDCLGNVLFEL